MARSTPLKEASDAINCLAYLAADAEFSKAADLYRKAEASGTALDIRNQAIEAATKGHRRAISAAETIRMQARDAAIQANRQAVQLAEETYWSAEKARKEAAENAWRNAKAVEETRYQARIDALNVRPRDKAAEDASLVALQQAKQARIAAGRLSRVRDPAAVARYERAKETAESAERRALEAADRAFREAKEAADAAARQAQETAELTYQQARTQALEAATPIYEAARERAIDAYVSAYANPSPELYRDVAGYDRELVLKMALAERERCPE